MQLTREEAKSDQCAALLHRDGHGSCFRSRTRAPATCQETLVEDGVFSVSCLRPRGRTSHLFSERAAGGNRARAMLPPSDDTEWLPSPCRLLSLQLQEMTSRLIIVNVNWDDDKCRKLNHGSLRAPRALCSGDSAGFLASTLIINTEKNILLLQGPSSPIFSRTP